MPDTHLTTARAPGPGLGPATRPRRLHALLLAVALVLAFAGTAAHVDAGVVDDDTFRERNASDPGRHGTTRLLDIRYVEMNVFLPGMAPLTPSDWQLIVDNLWGEDFVFATPATAPFPSADDVPQPRHGVVTY